MVQCFKVNPLRWNMFVHTGAGCTHVKTSKFGTDTMSGFAFLGSWNQIGLISKNHNHIITRLFSTRFLERNSSLQQNPKKLVSWNMLPSLLVVYATCYPPQTLTAKNASSYGQDELIRRCAASAKAAGKAVVVVLNVGSPKAAWRLGWRDDGNGGAVLPFVTPTPKKSIP